MATYQYRCSTHGLFDVGLPMGTATPRRACPHCDAAAPRVYAAPLLSLAPRELVAAIDRTERTRDEPDVVAAPAGPSRRRVPTAPPNPALRRLPRP